MCFRLVYVTINTTMANTKILKYACFWQNTQIPVYICCEFGITVTRLTFTMNIVCWRDKQTIKEVGIAALLWLNNIGTRKHITTVNYDSCILLCSVHIYMYVCIRCKVLLHAPLVAVRGNIFSWHCLLNTIHEWIHVWYYQHRNSK